MWFITECTGTSDASIQGSSTVPLATGILAGASMGGVIATISVVSIMVLIMKYREKQRGKALLSNKYVYAHY